MTLSRRAFVHTLGVGGAFVLSGGLVAARGREAFVGMGMPDREPGWSDWVPGLDEPSAIRLSSNENPNGPGDRALDAIRAALGESNRYPFVFAQSVTAAIAKRQGVKEENVLVGCGSGEILRMSVMAFTSPSKPLVVASPTYEDPEHTAEAFGTPVRRVKVNAALELDLAAMAAQSGGAGLVFLCNPNNPTGTVHAAGAVADFIGEVRKASPDGIVLADEAYHEYVDDPGYKTAIPLALEDPHVVVSRTFSKVYGMAGLRLGYAIARKETIRPPAEAPAAEQRERARGRGGRRHDCRRCADRTGAAAQPRGARVHAEGARRHGLPVADVEHQLHHGAHPPAGEGLPGGVPQGWRAGGPGVPTARGPRAHLDRDHGRDAAVGGGVHARAGVTNADRYVVPGFISAPAKGRAPGASSLSCLGSVLGFARL